VVDAAALIEQGLVNSGVNRIKILGNGLLNKKLTVKVSALSATAKEKISQAGGQVEEETKVA
jgi:large subunit ribosomal protein L15